MDNRTQTPMQESSATVEVARAFDDVENVPLCDSPAPPYDVSHDDLSSDTECAADATNEPQPNGSPDVSSKSTAESFASHDSRDENGFDIGQGGGLIDKGDNESTVSDAPSIVFDQGDAFASSAASDSNTDRDDESVLSATSDYADDGGADSTCSLDPAYFEYIEVHGRRYHAEPQGESCRYFWPNDGPQQELSNLFHEAELCLLGGQLHEAPISRDVQEVLDVGTGTGIWAIDFADEHPGAQVVGTDISPVQPKWVPPNLQFQMDDANLEWTFEERFELIHSRGMTGSITDWVEFAKGAFGALQPSGYFECHELSMSFRSDDETLENCESIIRWEDFWKDVGTNSGRSFTVVEDGRLEKSMGLAGFTDIETRVYKMPVGGWPKDPRLKKVGLYTYAALDVDLEGLLLRPAVEVLGWSLKGAIMFAAQLRKELRSGKVHAYLPLKVVFGQKP